MAIKFEKIQAGMTLYDRRRTRMGNTTMTTLSEWPVHILEVDEGARRFLMSWNGNAPGWRTEHSLNGLFAWSMSDADQAIVKRSEMVPSLVFSVTRRKPCPKCKNRHASEACPNKEAR